MLFKHNVALVTGGTLGTGRATAITFGAAGAKAMFSGRRNQEGREMAVLIRDAEVECLFV
ncbi:MAG: hypothetical protein KME45_13845 [Stenomitos rutilans HA7619-LM2]|jgi:NAD(P)-dependent dehydrogenase (short-subunit alcohol dehydrogenase family)|nr:hypothetical protein [Stenomitos rutilans HA7619-LM2]